jgi:catechol 2,3-dioxygenase-like lactoylglutathione lyase family enzyme
MAYRLVLEVPETVAQEVNTAIGTVPDAQVLVMRNSHGLGFNDPYLDLSVAAHSLAVIERIYQWMLDYGEPWPDVRLVMHDGRRVSFAKADVSLVIAAIRRDQPWVDHTMPQIGVHEPKPWLDAREARGVQVVPLDLDDPGSLARRLDTAPRIPVHNLAPAEQFYEEILGLRVAGRAIRREDGTLRAIEGHYDPKLARLRAEEADVVFLENGPLQLTLERVRRGLPLPYGTDPAHIHTTASPEHIGTVRGRVLMNGYNLLESDSGTLRFVDPFNVIWTISPAAGVDSTAPAALRG